MFLIVLRILPFLCFVICTVCSEPISDQAIKQNVLNAEKYVAAAMKKLKTPGCVITVVRKNKVIHEACFGVAEQNGEKMKLTTMVPLSSLTKNVSAILVAGLIDKGWFSWDDLIRKYIPPFYIGNEEVSSVFTVRDAISHRSGAKHFSSDSLWRCGYPREKCIKSLACINNVSGFRRKYGYQNIIFELIEEVIVKACNESYSRLFNENIVSKLKLPNTSCRPLFVEKSWFRQLVYNFKNSNFIYAIKNIFNIKKHDVAVNHTTRNGIVVPCKMTDYMQRMCATAGVSMSIQDMGKWLRLLLGQGTVDGVEIASQKSFSELTSKQVVIDNIKEDDPTFPKNRLSDLYYGMGFFGAIYSDNGQNPRKVLFHMGGVNGVCTFFAIFPDDDIGICVLSNFGGTDRSIFSELMTWQLADSCFDYPYIDWAQIEIKLNEKHELRMKKEYTELKEKNPGPPAKLEKYAGEFTSRMYGDIKVALQDGKLFIDNGIRKAELTHLNQNMFTVQSYDLCDNYGDKVEFVVFYENSRGQFDELYISCLGENDSIFKRK